MYILIIILAAVNLAFAVRDSEWSGAVGWSVAIMLALELINKTGEL